MPSHATWTALRRHYLSRPAALLNFWRLRKQNKRPRHNPGASLRPIESWESGKASRADYMSPDQVGELRKWAAAQPGKSTTASVSIALWIAALEAEDVAIDESMMILFNSRRYLAPEQQVGHGNFAVGIPVLIPEQPSPSVVTP